MGRLGKVCDGLFVGSSVLFFLQLVIYSTYGGAPVEGSGPAIPFAISEPEQKGFCHACRKDSPRTSHRFCIPVVHRLPISGSVGAGPSRHDEVAGSFHRKRSNHARCYKWRSGSGAGITDACKLAWPKSGRDPRGPGRQLVAGQVGHNRSSFRAGPRTARSESGSEYSPHEQLGLVSTCACRNIPRKLATSNRIGSQFFSHANCIAWSVRAVNVNGDGDGRTLQASRTI
jgi:hypothetical protein